MPGDCHGRSCKNKYICRATVFWFLQNESKWFHELCDLINSGGTENFDSHFSWWRRTLSCRIVRLMVVPLQPRRILTRPVATWMHSEVVPPNCLCPENFASTIKQKSRTLENSLFPPNPKTWLRARCWLLFRDIVALSFPSRFSCSRKASNCIQWLKENADESENWKLGRFIGILVSARAGTDTSLTCCSFWRNVFFATSNSRILRCAVSNSLRPWRFYRRTWMCLEPSWLSTHLETRKPTHSCFRMSKICSGIPKKIILPYMFSVSFFNQIAFWIMR